MKCKNCGHKVIFHKGEWKHWNEIIHDKGGCYCDKPLPKYKTLSSFKKKRGEE